MRLVIIGTALLGMLVGSLCATSQAQARDETYEAIIDAPEVFVHSGPGQDYYPTTKLKRGTRVTVLRHMPGGWLRIQPPPGSFSWIAKDCVDRLEGGRGRVNKSNFFRIGSEFQDTALTSRHRILIGEEVEILGEQVLQTDRGPVAMYKIRPPVGEHRWIPGQAAVPADGDFRPSPAGSAADLIARQAGPEKRPDSPSKPAGSQADPFAQGTAAANPFTEQSRPEADPGAAAVQRELVNRPVVKISADGSYRRVAPPAEELQQSRERLKELDAEFRRIISLEKSDWDFATLERDYLELRDAASMPAFQAHVDLRLDAVRRYQAEKIKYDEFMRLTAETSKRDAQLLALQRATLSAGENASDSLQAEPMTQSVPAAPGDPVSPFQPVGPPQAMPSGSSPAPVSGEPGQPDGNHVVPNSGTGPRPAMSPPAEAGSATQVRPAPRAVISPLTPPRSAPLAAGAQPTGTPPGGAAQRFSGAGVVQRAAWVVPGGPRHVLLTPNGRVLAYLQGAAGVDLDRYVGQSVGVGGPRGFRRDLMTDFIEVQYLAPVRLRK